jgi:uncharacterized membrane protein YhhN
VIETVPFLLVGACASAIAYGANWISGPESLIRSAFKTLPVFLLALAALANGQPLLLITALAACALGDYFLSREGEAHFLYGLGAFLVGHLFYIAFFCQSLDFNTLVSRDLVINIAIMAALCFLVLLRLWPFLNEMRSAVIVYTAAIALMAISAKASTPPQLVLVGVAMFVVSDIILAFDKFTPLTNSWKRWLMPYLVWVLYFTGQLSLVYGLISHS